VVPASPFDKATSDQWLRASGVVLDVFHCLHAWGLHGRRMDVTTQQNCAGDSYNWEKPGRPWPSNAACFFEFNLPNGNRMTEKILCWNLEVVLRAYKGLGRKPNLSVLKTRTKSRSDEAHRPNIAHQRRACRQVVLQEMKIPATMTKDQPDDD